MKNILLILTLFIGISVNAQINNQQIKEELLVKLDKYEKECIDYRQEVDSAEKRKEILINARKKQLEDISIFEEKYENFIRLDRLLNDIDIQLNNHNTNKNISLNDLKIYKNQYLNELSKTLKPKDEEYSLYKFNKKYLLSDSDFLISLIYQSPKLNNACINYNYIKKKLESLSL